MPTEGEHLLVKDDLLLSLRVSQYLGVAPVRFESTRSGTLVYYSRAHRYYGIFLHIVLCTSCMYYLPVRYSRGFETVKECVIFYLLVNNKLFSAIFLTCYAFYSFKRTKILLECADQITKIKKNINPNDLPSTKYMKTLLVLFALWIPMALKYENYELFAVSVHNLVVQAMMLSVNVQFTIVARSINTVFEDINLCLRGLLPDVHQEGLPVRRRLAAARRLRQLTHGYAAAAAAAGRLASAEGGWLGMQLLGSASVFVTNIYSSITSPWKFATDSLVEISYQIVHRVSWIAINLVKIALLVEPCHDTLQTLRRMRLLVGEIAAFSHDVILDATEPFIDLLLNRFSYSALGVFTLGRPVIYTIIGGAIAILSLMI